MPTRPCAGRGIFRVAGWWWLLSCLLSEEAVNSWLLCCLPLLHQQLLELGHNLSSDRPMCRLFALWTDVCCHISWKYSENLKIHSAVRFSKRHPILVPPPHCHVELCGSYRSSVVRFLFWGLTRVCTSFWFTSRPMGSRSEAVSCFRAVTSSDTSKSWWVAGQAGLHTALKLHSDTFRHSKTVILTASRMLNWIFLNFFTVSTSSHGVTWKRLWETFLVKNLLKFSHLMVHWRDQRYGAGVFPFPQFFLFFKNLVWGNTHCGSFCFVLV